MLASCNPKQTKVPKKDKTVSSSTRTIRSSPSVSRSASTIRARFLSQLGISKDFQHSTVPLSRRNSHDAYLGSDSFGEVLKGDHGKSDESFDDTSANSESGSSLSSNSVDLRKGYSGVSFDSNVVVHPIPSRAAYSDRIRNTLWTHPIEMQQNTARNCVEFAAENWDWRQVVDDEDMVLCDGEPIHPVHFAYESNMGRHFCEVMFSQKSY